MSEDEVLSLYNAQIGIAKSLMQNKNHDYGEAWRDMRVSSLTDLSFKNYFASNKLKTTMAKLC